MGAHLQYLLITVVVVALEKVSFSNTQIAKAVNNTLTVNDKHYLVNRENLMQPIQMQLSEKEKNFLNFFLHFQNLY